MEASFSGGRSSSPFHDGKPSSLNSSTSSTSSLMNGSRVLPCSSSSSAMTSFYGGGEYGSRSMSMADAGYSGEYNNYTPVSDPLIDNQLIGEPLETTSRSGESISVTIRFRHMSEREYQRGDDIAWHPEGDKIVRNDYNPMTAYAFDRVFGPLTITEEVYEVAARSVVKGAMEGINGMFNYKSVLIVFPE